MKATQLESLSAEIHAEIERQHRVIAERKMQLLRAEDEARRLQGLRLEYHPSRAPRTISARDMQTLEVQQAGISDAVVCSALAVQRCREALGGEQSRLVSLRARLRAVEIEQKTIEKALDRKKLRSVVNDRRRLEEPDL